MLTTTPDATVQPPGRHIANNMVATIQIHGLSTCMTFNTTV